MSLPIPVITIGLLILISVVGAWLIRREGIGPPRGGVAQHRNDRRTTLGRGLGALGAGGSLLGGAALGLALARLLHAGRRHRVR